jgi:hypothetical protein
MRLFTRNKELRKLLYILNLILHKRSFKNIKYIVIYMWYAREELKCWNFWLKRPLGTPMHKWEDNIDFESKGTSWLELTQNMVQLMAFCKDDKIYKCNGFHKCTNLQLLTERTVWVTSLMRSVSNQLHIDFGNTLLHPVWALLHRLLAWRALLNSDNASPKYLLTSPR